MRKMIILAAMLLSIAPAHSKALKIIQPLPAEMVGANQVVGVDVQVSESAQQTLAVLEAKAAEKRTQANLPVVDPATDDKVRPAPDVYATLPLARMLPLVIEDQTREWGLNAGRAIKLSIQVDTLKTANAGMAILLSSSDQLAGVVSVADAGSGEKLGEFYVDVLNVRAGMLGLAMRGAGVREKLALEFGKRVAQTLSGSKSAPKKPKA